MDLRDPVPGTPWVSQQYWVCPACGRHFWTSYAQPTAKAAEEKPAAAKPAATAAPARPAAQGVPPAADAAPAAQLATDAPVAEPTAPKS